MQLSQDSIGGNQITAYRAGEVRINHTPYHESLIVSPQKIISPWVVNSVEQLQASSLSELLAFQPQVIILGTGNTLQFPAPQLLAEIHAANIGIEVMDNAGACRTYNVLASENRRVAMALIMG